MRVSGLTALALAAAVSASAQAHKPAPARPPVQVRTWTSQTSVWVGDRFVYQVEFRRPPSVEIFLDDLLPEKLKLEGLEVLETSTDHDASSDAVVIDRIRYTLAAYTVEPQMAGIGPITVRISERRPGQGAADALPAGEVVVPPLHVGLRSTIAASTDAVEIRDARAVRAVPRRIQLAERIGWVLLAISVLPVVLWAIRVVQRLRQARPKRPSRPAPRQRRAALDAIRSADVSTPEARRDAYGALDAWIREGVIVANGASAAALTPDEVVAALGDGSDRESMQQLLLECERAKYGTDVPGADRWVAAVDAAATLTVKNASS